MTIEIVIPDLGHDVAECRLIHWLKHEGDSVAAGEPIVEVETDKVNVEVEAALEPSSVGVLQRILVAEGETVHVGAPIAVVTTAELEPLP